MDGTSDPPLITTDVNASTFYVPAQNISPKQWSFLPTISPSHPAAQQAPPCGRPRTRRGSLAPNSNPVCNAGRQLICRHPNTLSHFFQRQYDSSNSSYPKVTATFTCRRAPNRLSRTLSEGAKAHPTYITTEGDHCTRNPYTLQSPTQTCGHHPSQMSKEADPSTNTCHHLTRP